MRTSPAWSPDAKWISFQSNEAGNFDIHVVPASGGVPRRVTLDAGDDENPSFSHDGSGLYFSSSRTGQEQIWRIPVGGGDAVQVTRDGGVQAAESADGQWLFYTRRSTKDAKTGALFRKSLHDGTPDLLLTPSVAARGWSLSSGRIWYALPTGSGAVLHSVDVRTGKVESFGELPPQSTEGISVSPDARTVLYSKDDTPGSDLMLIERLQ